MAYPFSTHWVNCDVGLSHHCLFLQALLFRIPLISVHIGTCCQFHQLPFSNETLVTVSGWEVYFFIRPFEKRTYYALAMSVRLSVRPSVRPSFPDFFSTCFEISIWNLVYAFSRWHDMSSLSFITIGSLWPSLQPKVGQTQFLQSWPYKSR